MFYYITKSEYFDALNNNEIETVLKQNMYSGLKHIQDACTISKIITHNPANIGEIGGGHSRSLPFLAHKGWTCTNIDPLEGVGQGPITALSYEGVRHVSASAGSFSNQLAPNSFDILYSISVIEHVEEKELNNFFADIFRLLKPGGITYHAVDVYLQNTESQHVLARNSIMKNAALSAGFIFINNEPLPTSIFQCEYASNSDITIRSWNKTVPNLREMRNRSQSVSLMLGLIKPH